jgi:hypothetical protein
VRIFGLNLILIVIFSSFAEAQVTQPDPGEYFLRVIKAVADSNSVDNPENVSAMLHMSFTNSGYTEAPPNSCKPDAQWIRNLYNEARQNWFHPLPTGNPSALYPAGYTGPKTKTALIHPTVKYSTFITKGCERNNADESAGYLDFYNIPAYACISEVQIKTIFPGVEPPAGPEGPGITGPAPSITYPRFYLTKNVRIIFDLMPISKGTEPDNISECLYDLHLTAIYPLRSLHKPDLSH